ncbi:MAG: hypothetical protein E6K24_10250 [Gammaproteobacteria bacterium]|nr:MAG: hypothetical protein E6K24_10250 [Gammaproteobacteria bacterium]
MIRLQKLLAEAGLGSRRTSEERIRAGRGRLGLDGRRLDRGRPCRASYSFITGPSAAPGGTGRRAPGPGLPPAGLAPPGRGVRPAGRRPPEATRHLANSGPGRIDTPVPRNQNTRLVLRRGTQAANGSRL